MTASGGYLDQALALWRAEQNPALKFLLRETIQRRIDSAAEGSPPYSDEVWAKLHAAQKELWSS